MVLSRWHTILPLPSRCAAPRNMRPSSPSLPTASGMIAEAKPCSLAAGLPTSRITSSEREVGPGSHWRPNPNEVVGCRQAFDLALAWN